MPGNEREKERDRETKRQQQHVTWAVISWLELTTKPGVSG